ncbi:RHS repeat-associated core domain-containing protein [Prosthecobacter fusiformis]|uniref:RHS repeat-associated core domain-containing protein n=1 Tax=Prosthecobacter fusiformis TaxID=48464 RepID=UPI003CE4633C
MCRPSIPLIPEDYSPGILSSGYYNYGYRYYSPELGRWLSRDPIGEEVFRQSSK